MEKMHGHGWESCSDNGTPRTLKFYSGPDALQLKTLLPKELRDHQVIPESSHIFSRPDSISRIPAVYKRMAVTSNRVCCARGNRRGTFPLHAHPSCVSVTHRSLHAMEKYKLRHSKDIIFSSATWLWPWWRDVNQRHGGDRWGPWFMVKIDEGRGCRDLNAGDSQNGTWIRNWTGKLCLHPYKHEIPFRYGNKGY